MQHHLPLDMSEADVLTVNRANDTASHKGHQNHQEQDFCLSFAAAPTDLPDSTCAASMTLRSLKSDWSTCKAAHKQAANQAASQSKFRMQREARFWSRSDGNNHRGVVIDHRGSHLDSRKLSRSSLRFLRLSSTPPPPPTRPTRHPCHMIFSPT